MAHAVKCMSDGLEERVAALEAKWAEVSDTLADNAKRMAELKVRLTELAGIAAGQVMSIEEKLDEVLKRLPPRPDSGPLPYLHGNRTDPSDSRR
jgi:hypothetical protein